MSNHGLSVHGRTRRIPTKSNGDRAYPSECNGSSKFEFRLSLIAVQLPPLASHAERYIHGDFPKGKAAISNRGSSR